MSPLVCLSCRWQRLWSHLGRYFFRNEQLRHLRVEQFNRYFRLGDAQADVETAEDTVDWEDQVGPGGFDATCKTHRNYDAWADAVLAREKFRSTMPSVSGAVRRFNTALGASRLPFLEPMGDSRENFYQQRLVMSLAWYSPCAPQSIEVDGQDALLWTFCWDPPAGIGPPGRHLERETLQVATRHCAISFEERCQQFEQQFSDPEYDLACPCCHGRAAYSGKCESCEHAVG